MHESRRGVSRTEILGVLILLLTATSLLAISWRKWPDAQIDFGRELYLPWQINEGAVLYRDIDANYGPLSHYFNAFVFRALGTGFMQLVWANLFVYACILTLLYRLARLAAGPGGAFVASLGFIGLFSFNQFVGIGNYNFVSPYAHETTHGFLLLLVLIWLCVNWLRDPQPARTAVIGLVLGASLLLKVEIVFAAAVVMAVGLVLVAIGRSPNPRSASNWKHLATLAGAGLVPPLLATLVLYRTGRFEPVQAFLWANAAWTGLFLFPGIAEDPVQAVNLGTDAVGTNLGLIVVSGLLSLIGSLLLALVSRVTSKARKSISIAGTLVLGLLALFLAEPLPWIDVARTFPIWLVVLAVTWFWEDRRAAEAPGDASNARWLIWAAGAALLARMALNPRIYHYGYCQAALAGVLSILGVFLVWPRILCLGDRARVTYVTVLSLFLAGGLWQLQVRSRSFYAMKTLPVGEGTDRFYAYDPRVNPVGFFIEDARRSLAAMRDSGRLFVVPEGIMVNYLSRRPTPTHVYTFNAYWLRWTRSVVDDLERRPPAHVLLISRNFQDYGIQRFGESEPHGAPIIAWIAPRYVPVRGLGGNPLDSRQLGMLLLARRDQGTPPPPEPSHVNDSLTSKPPGT